MDSPLGNISKSSLVSLKAELLRKKQEIQKLIRTEETNSAETSGTSSDPVNFAKLREKPVKKLTIQEKANKNVASRAAKDAKPIDPEEAAELKRSQDALAAKSRIYDDLMKGTQVLDSGRQLLVNFDKKRTEEKDKINNDDDDDDIDSDDEWTEFTDALGRTRKCLKEDLKYYQAQNKHLEKLTKPTPISHEKNQTEVKELSAELLSSDMKRELMRKQWEEEEQKLAGKSDIHYQDVLFSEARQHGVGYFRFSSDEATRAAQLIELEKTRTATLDARAKAKEVAKLRKRQFKQRLLMTENRKRESQGLPPLPVDNVSSSDDEAANSADVAREETNAQAALSDLVATKLEEFRKANKTREWDVGKEGQMSQEEWVEKKREERISEFAPILTEDAGIERNARNDLGEKENSASGSRKDVRHGDASSESHKRRRVDSFVGTKDGAGLEVKGNGGENNTGNQMNNADTLDFHSELTDDQLMRQMEEEEELAAKTMFCFKRKWSGKEDSRRGQKLFRSDGRKESQLPRTGDIVDTRFMSNSQRKGEVAGSPGRKVEEIASRMERVQETSSAVEESSLQIERVEETGRPEDLCELNDFIGPPLAPEFDGEQKQDKVGSKGTAPSSCGESTVPPILSELGEKSIRTSKGSPTLLDSENHTKYPSRNLENTEREFVNSDELIGPPVPSDLLMKQTQSKFAESLLKSNCREISSRHTPRKDLIRALEEFIGPPLPDSNEVSQTNQSSKEVEKPQSPIAQFKTLPSNLVPRQAANIPSSLRPRQLIPSVIKTGKLLNKKPTHSETKETRKSTPDKTETRKSAPDKTETLTSPPNSTGTEKGPTPLESTVPLKAKDSSCEENSIKSNDYFRQLFDESRRSSAVVSVEMESDTPQQSSTAAVSCATIDATETTSHSTAHDDPTTEDTSESTENTGEHPTFNFVSAKAKTNRLKKALDRPNVIFDATGRIVKKVSGAETSRIGMFRSQGEINENSLRERTGSKFVEIAPPSSMDYYTGSHGGNSSRGSFSRGGKRGAGKGMMDAVTKGMERVEKEKKARAGKKEKGLLDII